MKINKQILEAIDKGIRLALDDYQNVEDIESISSKHDIINPKSDEYIKYRIEWDNLIKKFDDGQVLLNKEELARISYLSKYFGFKYDEKYEGHWRNNKTFLQDAIDCVCQVDPKADLNWMDVSSITEMDSLFAKGNCTKFNGDISKWDVSNVTDMASMFRDSEFNGDISNWDVSNVTYMHAMFRNSKFNQNIGNWNVSKCKSCSYMFMNSLFNQDISRWKLPVGCNFDRMFGEYEANKVSDNEIVGYTIKKEFMPPKVRAQYTKYEKYGSSKKFAFKFNRRGFCSIKR